MTLNGDSRKPVWITEFGAPSIGPSGIDASAQRAELSQAVAYVNRHSWIGALYIYTWQDKPNGSGGSNGVRFAHR